MAHEMGGQLIKAKVGRETAQKQHFDGIIRILVIKTRS